MATVNIQIQNNTGGTATLTLAHQSGAGMIPQSKRWVNLADAAVGAPYSFDFDLDSPAAQDTWYIHSAVSNGVATGLYSTRGSRVKPIVPWRLTAVDDADDDNNPIINVVLEVHPTYFIANFAGGQFRGRLERIGPYTEKIRHIFVLMLENRSFDHIFGWSGITGTNPDGSAPRTLVTVPPGTTNTVGNLTIPVGAKTPANTSLTADPGHEFEDVLQQLGGDGAALVAGAYPANLPMSGFASNFTTALHKWGIPNPTVADYAQVMSGVGQSPAPSLVMHQLAKAYAVCDNWFASMPGPTWPNRFFAVAGSSGGLDASPTPGQLFASEYMRGFTINTGNVFKRLEAANNSTRIYKDFDNQFADNPSTYAHLGWQTITAGITGMRKKDINKYRNFADDLKDFYPHQFTFIEPHYGSLIVPGSYQGGSSQHPMDGLLGGERLIKSTYEAIRNSPLWDHSMLIVTYDETGGIFDHVVPPANVPAPDGQITYRVNNFNFQHLGPRVPAVVISPWITEGVIDHTQYDHTSMIATALRMFVGPAAQLGARDAAAASLDTLLQPLPRGYDDCPTTVDVPAMPPVKRDAAATVFEAGAGNNDPLPASGNINGFLLNTAKVEAELSDGSPEALAAISTRLSKLTTLGKATAYIESVYRVHVTDLSDGDKIDDILSGFATDAEKTEMAQRLGLSTDDLHNLRSQSLAANLMSRLQNQQNTADNKAKLREQIALFEGLDLELGDDDWDGFYLPHGTSALIRAWS
jgi:phospholipase C